jgi:hypothetical protein
MATSGNTKTSGNLGGALGFEATLWGLLEVPAKEYVGLEA